MDSSRPIESSSAGPIDIGGLSPRYDGRSIANLPATVGHLLGVAEGWAAPPLESQLLSKLSRCDRVILILLDGIGWNRLNRELAQADELLLEEFSPAARMLEPITSVTPATTSVATTVLLGNGSGPAQTGMLGYTFLLPSLGLLANMLLWKPAGSRSAITGEIERWGVEPESFLPTPSLAQVLGTGAVRSSAFLPANISGTPLSRMQLRGAEVHGYLNWPDMWSQLRRWGDEGGPDDRFAYAYLSDFDALSHRDGPEVPLWGELWRRWLTDFRSFVGHLTSTRGKTTVLVTADHGHVLCPRGSRIEIQDHPELVSLLAVPPGGEARHVNLYARGGSKEQLIAYCREHLSDAFHVLDADTALEAGLYGPTERAHPEAMARLGDVLLLAKGPAHLWDRDAPGTMLGMHGSLDGDEMLVPLLALEI